MRQITTIAMLGLVTGISFGQTIIEMKPNIGWTPDLSAKTQKEWRRREELLAKDSPTQAEQKELDKLMINYNETMESIWDIIGGACSWYCGEGPYKVIESSYLPKQGDNEYTGTMAHDFSFRTAWVEGVKGYGIGEYVEYYFRNQAPRITEIKIFNGYVKSEKAWIENSRVSKLKLSVNGKDLVLLNLEDIQAQQNFKIDPMGKRADGKDLIIRFTIADIYKGSKFDDTAITEIYFDGIDVHCFARGTKITSTRGIDKNIEELTPGDTILSYDPSGNIFFKDIIEKIERVRHNNLVKYRFEDGSGIISTQDHPFLLERGWSSLVPEKTMSSYKVGEIDRIRIGDKFIKQDYDNNTKLVTLKSIEILKEEQETFTISKLRRGTTFIANGLIVAVENILNNQ
jgi:hypothetical protein